MKIAVALSWYDEPEASLTRCVESLADVADVLVAYDGAWAEFPDARGFSTAAQTDAVYKAAAAIGVEVQHWAEAEPWPSQVAKRAALYEHAADVSDWVLVIDADEWISEAAGSLRAELALGKALVAEVGLRHHDGARRKPGPARRLFSAAEGLTVERAHNGVRTKTGKWLTGDHAYVTLEPPLQLSHVVTIEHSNGADRSRERQVADNVYRNARRAKKLEQWRR